MRCHWVLPNSTTSKLFMHRLHLLNLLPRAGLLTRTLIPLGLEINISPIDQHTTTFICPWGTFSYKKLPFRLKITGATFQRVMSYAFHDIHNIIQPYLDDLPSHSVKRQDHPAHLHEIFLHCWHYCIRLNPHKCVFCVESGKLLGFIVSREGIRLDPLKFEAILNLPPPASL